MQIKIHVDCAIIGAGQGGALARMMAESGHRVALIDRGYAGGTCVNRGCTPTKARIASARRFHEVRTASRLGVYAGEVKVELPEVVHRSNEIVQSFRDGTEKRLLGLEGVTFLKGTARFNSPTSLQVELNDGGTREVEADRIVISTGLRPEIPDIPGIQNVPFLDSTSALELMEIPPQLVILGGGYIACEYGQMFARFGSRVTILQSGPHILSREDSDIAEELTQILEEEGLRIMVDTDVQRLEEYSGRIRVFMDGENYVEGTHLLLATGQTPLTSELNLEVAGVQTDESGHVVVDEFLQAAPNIFALGDVKGGPAFTHIAYDDARILHRRLCQGELVSCHDRLVPYTVFTDPQLGRVGLSEREAQSKGLEYRVAKLAIADTARGIESGDDKGLFKVLVAKDSDNILGAAILCKEGGELMTVIQLAMMGRLPYTDLRDGVFAHPTQTESFNNLFLAMDRQESQNNAPGCEPGEG